jgi:hypothetical protein
MYEEAYIDKHSHSAELTATFFACVRFNQAIGCFMEYAFYHPETVVIITADHETGGIALGTGAYELRTDFLQYQLMSVAAFSKMIATQHQQQGENFTWDFVRRQLILEYVERFRNAYCLKDLNFLEQIFSDDALIITGKVIKQVKSDINRNNLNNEKIVYSKQNKKQYLTNLARVFRNNKRINVLFDDIKVVKHPAKADFYGVTLKQGWSSDGYSDIGYVFLLWDFSNEDAPQIHVRTWQPDQFNNAPLPEEEIFSIDDFDI